MEERQEGKLCPVGAGLYALIPKYDTLLRPWSRKTLPTTSARAIRSSSIQVRSFSSSATGPTRPKFGERLGRPLPKHDAGMTCIA